MRTCGTLLPVFSLPSEHGIGNLGRAARKWVDFLAEAGQRWWQILPLGPTGYGDSPYQSSSVFAGNPYLIDPDALREEGLLTAEECAALPGGNRGRIDYGALWSTRGALLGRAFSRFRADSELEGFCEENRYWLADYALYSALKARFGGLAWSRWPDEVRLRRPDALRKAENELRSEIRCVCFVQYEFSRQLRALSAYAAGRGVGIIGDLPIYAAADSADVWSRPELFQLDSALQPTAVAGCPPDAFSADGQLWGNPLYRWDRMRQDGYAWWLQRLRVCFRNAEAVRFDHFRGLAGYYAVPAGDRTARYGKWQPGPGMDFIGAVRREFGPGRLIAEDLGYLTEEVHSLRRESGAPGMKVLQFAFDPQADSAYLPHKYERNCVAYTGTHDNDTMAGWLRSAPADSVAFAERYLGVRRGGPGEEMAFVRAVLFSLADTAVIPAQDWLGLGSEARINRPAVADGNWCWRLDPGAADSAAAEKIRTAAEVCGRLAAPVPGSVPFDGSL